MTGGAGEQAGRAERQAVDTYYEPDPERPGWYRWGPTEGGHFNDLFGQMWVRPEQPTSGGRRATVRIVPPGLLTSANGTLHGGALTGFLDIALFAGATGCGVAQSASAVTLDLSVQFMAAGRAGLPLDACVELMRETGRLLFLRGEVMQEGERIAGFTAIVRKPTSR